MFAPDERWLRAFDHVVPAALRRFGCPPNSCVEAGCIGVGVSQAFGFVVEPIPVAVHVTNGCEATVLPAPPELRTSRRRRDGFEGHLVLFFPGASVMSDLTAVQFNDPRRGLLVPGPVTGKVDRTALAGEGIVADMENGTVIHYQEMVGNVAWRALPAWRESSAMSITVVARELREYLASGAKQPRSARRS